MIRYALDAENDDKLFLRWAVMYQAHMGFEEFKRELGSGEETADDSSVEEILVKVKGIIG